MKMQFDLLTCVINDQLNLKFNIMLWVWNIDLFFSNNLAKVGSHLMDILEVVSVMIC